MFKIRLFPLLILLLGLAVTFVISYSAFQDHHKLKRQSFESLCRTFESKIQKQLVSNAQILYSSAAFISSTDTIIRNEWHNFQVLNKSLNVLPGIQSIGYSIVVDKKGISSFEKRVQDEGFPNFKIIPEGERDFYTSVIYIEPTSKCNMQVLGFDAYTETQRRRAMSQARDNDLATLSGKISLVQDSGEINQPGVVIFAPVFKKGFANVDSEARKAAIEGWVFSAYRINDLIKNTLLQWDYETIRLKIYQDQTANPDDLLFDSDTVFRVQHSSQMVRNMKLPLVFNDHLWTLEFSGYKDQYFFLPVRIMVIIINGVIISLLLFVLVINLIGARTKTMQIQILNDELNKVNLNKDRFISLLAHDLKSPFNALLGFSELLSENLNELKKSEIENYVSRIYASAQLSFLLLDELLMWARVQSDQFPFKPEALNLNEICRTLVHDHLLIAEKKNITVSFPDSETLFVMADELMLKTILRNLLVNAIKFTKSGGSVQLRITKSGTKNTVSVSDNGIGMSPEEKTMLFDITKLKSKPGTADEQGTGLGLLLCMDMVIKNGGEIWVESTPGKGSVFSFSLPQANDFN